MIYLNHFTYMSLYLTSKAGKPSVLRPDIFKFMLSHCSMSGKEDEVCELHSRLTGSNRFVKAQIGFSPQMPCCLPSFGLCPSYRQSNWNLASAKLVIPKQLTWFEHEYLSGHEQFLAGEGTYERSQLAEIPDSTARLN